MLNFEDFAAAAKQVEHVAGCIVKKHGDGVRIFVYSFLANADGSVITRGFVVVEMTQEQCHDGKWSIPGPWLLNTFDRAIAAGWTGCTRYATAEEIAAYKAAAAKEAA